MSDSNKAVQTEIAAAAFLAVAAVVALVWLIPNNTQPAASDLDISPAFFPMLAAVVVLFLSLAMIAVRLSRQVQSSIGVSGRMIMIEVVIWGGVAAAIWFALPMIGFVPVSVFVILLGGVAVGYRRWWVLGLLAVVFSVTVDVGAWQIFTVDLP